jgi:hypothetical protein
MMLVLSREWPEKIEGRRERRAGRMRTAEVIESQADLFFPALRLSAAGWRGS